MGIDLAGTTLTSSAGLVATQGGKQIMKMATNGTLQRYNLGQPLFRASQSGAAAPVTIGANNTWNPVVFNLTSLNVGSCYNTANGRFTVPVGGLYLVCAHTYCVGAGGGWYVHQMFWVNGAATTRRPSGGLHRMTGHGHTSGYNDDSEAFEVIWLAASDYVQFYNFQGAYQNTHYPQYGHFDGYLLG